MLTGVEAPAFERVANVLGSAEIKEEAAFTNLATKTMQIAMVSPMGGMRDFVHCLLPALICIC